MTARLEPSWFRGWPGAWLVAGEGIHRRTVAWRPLTYVMAVVAGAVTLGACGHPHPPKQATTVAAAPFAEPDRTTTSTTEIASTTVGRARPPRNRASRSAVRPRTGASASAAGVAAGQGADGTHVTATAYCETGRTANGEHPYWGSAAGNRWPFGTRLRIVELGQVVTINDRIGHGSDLDLAFPGDCAGARRFGRRTVTVVAA